VSQPLPVSEQVMARIRRFRKTRGMSAQALADAITEHGYAISRSVLANQEARRIQTVPVDLAKAAADVFGIPIGDLFEGPFCSTCRDEPPSGFTCNACGASATTTAATEESS
jgi:transcriptional regulator with XRE-family HTH domain